MSEATAKVSEPKKISAIWVLPILVLIIGAWVTSQYYLSRGPVVEILFEDAEGLEAGRTKVRALSVDVGHVDEIRLADDLGGVIVSVQMAPQTARLLRDDSRFWVVKPRISAEGVSGLGTLLSGAYIQLYPGEGADNGKRSYKGLDKAPPTPPGVAGIRITLYGDTASSITAGAPVTYRGLQAGQVESVELDFDRGEVTLSVFIDAPYDDLITRGARFWNASGVHVNAGADGVEIDTQSLATLLAGGIAFYAPSGGTVSDKVESGARFRLFESRQAAQTDPFEYGKSYVLQFQQSLRGLAKNAPVEYRGIRVGTVEKILRDELGRDYGEDVAVSVLIRIEPGRFGMGDSERSVAKLETMIREGVEDSGMRATLETGNLLTGGLYVSLDNYPDQSGASIGKYKNYDTLPTISRGIEMLGQQVSNLLAKINAMPLEQTTVALNRTLASAEATLDSLNGLVGSEAASELPQRLNETLSAMEAAVSSYGAGSDFEQSLDSALGELEETLREVGDLVELLEDKPNALIFPMDEQPDPQPRASK